MGDLVLDIADHDIDGLGDAIQGGFDAIPRPPDVPPYEVIPLAIALRSGDGRIEGGLTGHSVWGWLYVKYLWVTEARRGQRLGKRLLDAAEHEAQRRGCSGVWLNTISFQAPAFYERQGYEKFGEIPDLPKGHKRFFYRKKLSSKPEGG